MNREIKFRVWNTYHKRYYDLISIHFETGIFTCFNKESKTGHTFGMIDCILEQYTGLKDKNGKEIYEGDIVRYDSDYRIGYDNSSAMFELEDVFDHNEVATFDRFPLYSLEIIGNIHEDRS